MAKERRPIKTSTTSTITMMNTQQKVEQQQHTRGFEVGEALCFQSNNFHRARSHAFGWYSYNCRASKSPSTSSSSRSGGTGFVISTTDSSPSLWSESSAGFSKFLSALFWFSWSLSSFNSPSIFFSSPCYLSISLISSRGFLSWSFFISCFE